MNAGIVRQQPYISQQSVRKALDAMVRGTPNDENRSLLYLTLVDDFLSDPLMPHMDTPREFAVYHILIDLITCRYSESRQSVELEPPSEHPTLDEMRCSFNQDTRTRFPDLIGWSILYYRYVRTDVNLFATGYPADLGIDERTFRRYQADAIKRLTRDLIQEEYSARRRQHRLYLYTQLPDMQQTHFLGREKLKREVEELIEQNPPAWVQISGPKGIGKTAFVQVILRNLIERDALDQIVWIHNPQSVEYVRRYLRQTLLPDGLVELGMYTTKVRAAIVLDNITQLRGFLPELRDCLNELINTRLFITNIIYVDISPKMKHIVLPPLEKRDVLSLVNLSYTGEETDDVEYGDDLWGRVGGNPLAVQLAISRNINLKNRHILLTSDILNESFEHVYDSLSLGSKQVLFTLAMCPENTVELAVLADLWPEIDLPVIELISCGLIVGTHERDEVKCSSGVDEQVKQLHGLLENAEWIIQTILQKLNEKVLALEWRSFPLIENILYRGWPGLPDNLALVWIQNASAEGLRRGNYAIWASILQNTSTSPDLLLQYVFCLRKLGELQRAEQLAQSVIRDSGTIGNFYWQGRALHELTLIFRQQGYYREAINCLYRIQILAADKYPDLLSKARLEYARIALDSNDPEQALSALKDADEGSPVVLTLHGEAFAAAGLLDEARKYFEAAIQHPDVNTGELGRLHAGIAQIDARRKHYESAREHFETAIMLLQKASDWFALGRAQTNLAALLIEYEDYVETRRLLLDARILQETLNDRVGLLHTQHNISLLENRLQS